MELSLRVGRRVLTSDGQETAGELVDMRLVTPVDPATWRLVRLQMRRSHREGDYVDITTLRPISWLQAANCRPGQIIGFQMPEMGLDGQARVV
ncbi:MAG: hypothetical protein JXL80_06510, partial [Planctomycetes bacterium]|nr:hypothetical protein [Planctomycetota bacterium]